ncbi:FkbM family methyltransferase [Roseibium porphyridii]|uniref:FkbM family methyltransferase n=1 Tax=Roseibium porphyridii TaxID=2866279 RepID=A0ABY8F7U2_9HYPH|nr:FkbM family methyltransferase [Roseibium sp. KMA01]WFE89925.1 FkbM family methyltransferase [Roseibium sp. KMA01]
MEILEKLKARRLRQSKRALRRSTGAAYAQLFNETSKLRGTSARVVWDGSVYIVSDPEMPRREYVFRHEKQGLLAYSDGLVARAENLGSAYFLENVNFQDGDIVFDCGANLGDLFLWFDHKNLEIEYIGFEPSPVEFKCAEQNVAPHLVYNLGLWNRDDELQFYVSSQGADSSLIEPSQFDEVITVQTKRLDALIENEIKFLKLEAEGAEPEILEGIGDKLDQIEYISADLGFERGKKSESTLVPVMNYLLRNGFELESIRHDRICALFRNRAFS